jgi:tight adherence protein C
MEDYIIMIIATVVFASFVVMEVIGKKYEAYVSAVSGSEYQLSEFYGIGFAWQQLVPALGYDGALGARVRESARILYGEKYCEYYSRLALAQAYTFAHLALVFCSILAGFTDGSTAAMVLLVGVVAALVLAKNYVDEPKNKLEKRTQECLDEFPNMVMKLSLMISSGMILREAWFLVKDSTGGQLHELMEQSCSRMANGMSDSEAIRRFGYEANAKEMKRFATELVQGIEKGSSELVGILTRQSDELWELKKQMALQKGEQASAKLLIPTALMFAGLLLVVVSASLSGQSI